MASPATVLSEKAADGDDDIIRANDERLLKLRAEKHALGQAVAMLLKQVDSAGAAGAQRMTKEGHMRDRHVQMLRTELDTIRHQVNRAKRRLSQIEDEHYELFMKMVPKRAEVQQMQMLRGTSKMAEQRYHDAHEQRERLEYEVDSYQMIYERIDAELPARASSLAQLVQTLRTDRDDEEEARLAARRSLAAREAAEKLLAAAQARRSGRARCVACDDLRYLRRAAFALLPRSGAMGVTTGSIRLVACDTSLPMRGRRELTSPASPMLSMELEQSAAPHSATPCVDCHSVGCCCVGGARAVPRAVEGRPGEFERCARGAERGGGGAGAARGGAPAESGNSSHC